VLLTSTTAIGHHHQQLVPRPQPSCLQTRRHELTRPPRTAYYTQTLYTTVISVRFVHCLETASWITFSTLTRVPSNLRPTTCERVHLVTRGHFRSRDKDDGHTIRSAITENLTALYVTEAELLTMEAAHCGNRDFQCIWLLWPWPWPDDLHIRTWSVLPGDIPDEQKWTSYVKAFESYHLTDRHDVSHILRRFVGGP